MIIKIDQNMKKEVLFGIFTDKILKICDKKLNNFGLWKYSNDYIAVELKHTDIWHLCTFLSLFEFSVSMGSKNKFEPLPKQSMNRNLHLISLFCPVTKTKQYQITNIGNIFLTKYNEFGDTLYCTRFQFYKCVKVYNVMFASLTCYST